MIGYPKPKVTVTFSLNEGKKIGYIIAREEYIRETSEKIDRTVNEVLERMSAL